MYIPINPVSWISFITASEIPVTAGVVPWYPANAAGTDFQTVLPQGLGYVIPAGGQSPIYTVTRGGLTSISGTDVSTGQLITRYDLEVGALVAPGREYMIGLLGDKKLSTELGTY